MSIRFLRPAFGILVFLFAAGTTAAQPISLAGEWRFALDRADAGVNEQWFSRALQDGIRLPGVLQAQGYGQEISTTTPWVLSLYERFWFLREDYEAYGNDEGTDAVQPKPSPEPQRRRHPG